MVGNLVGETVAGLTSTAGSWSYLLNYPTAVTMDQYSNLYIMDAGNNRVQRWSPGATYGITIISASLYNPKGLAIDPQGNIAVADQYYHRISRFTVSCCKLIKMQTDLI